MVMSSTGSSTGSSTTPITPSPNVFNPLSYAILGVLFAAVGYSVFHIARSYFGGSRGTGPAEHVRIMATVAKLFVTSASFVAALALNSAMNATFTDLANDTPWIKTGGPWLYAMSVIVISIAATYSLTAWIQTIPNSDSSKVFIDLS